jgi:hypothetical protein
MPDKSIINGLKNKYPDLHPLIFRRSVERAKTNGDLFDIIDTVPKKYPICWNEKEKRWLSTEDVYLTKQFLNDFK